MKSDKVANGPQQPPSEEQLRAMVKSLAFIAEEMVVLAFSDHPLVRVVTFDSDRPTGLDRALRWRDPEYRWAFPVFQLHRGKVDGNIASMAARFAASLAEAGMKPRPALLAAWLLAPRSPHTDFRQLDCADHRSLEEDVSLWTKSLIEALQPPPMAAAPDQQVPGPGS